MTFDKRNADDMLSRYFIFHLKKPLPRKLKYLKLERDKAISNPD